jgi:hypothetical protein
MIAHFRDTSSCLTPILMGKPCAKPGLARVSRARHGKLRIDKNWVAYFGLQLGHALWQKCVMGVAFLQEPDRFLREPDTTLGWSL